VIYGLARETLFALDPEHAHELTIRAFARFPRLSTAPFAGAVRDDPVQLLGLRFRNRVGLAAGLDKNADCIEAWDRLGFGFVEVGTVTAKAQPGNDKPRLFRGPASEAVVNRMGFNNDGAEAVARRLAARKRSNVIVGVNIGKTKVVPENEAIADYEKSTRLLAPFADYLVVNVSSPNTPGLRDLQAVDKLKPLLAAVRAQADETVPSRHVPLLVKIAPDLSDDDVLAVSDLAVELGLDGIVATNTTVSRDGLATSVATVEEIGPGGLSGAPLRQRALEVTRMVRDRVGPDLVIIGVGGITTAEDAWERLEAGATLVQGYTGFIYEGPLWPRRIQRRLGSIARRQRA